MNRSVSCVIPVFNGERFLAESIESVLAQRGFDIEIIVVDDGSTDGTRDVAHRFKGRATYVHQRNAGPAIARNEGIRRAAGEYVTLLDSDDLWHPDKTAIQVAVFEARHDVAICTAQMENFWSAEVEHEAATLQGGRLTQIQPNLGSSFMARRSLFEEIGLLDGTLEASRHSGVHSAGHRSRVGRGSAPQCIGEAAHSRCQHQSASFGRGGSRVARDCARANRVASEA